jgi:hypothetical protein
VITSPNSQRTILVEDDRHPYSLPNHNNHPIQISNSQRTILVEDDRHPYTLPNHSNHPILISNSQRTILVEDDRHPYTLPNHNNVGSSYTDLIPTFILLLVFPPKHKCHYFRHLKASKFFSGTRQTLQHRYSVLLLLRTAKS